MFNLQRFCLKSAQHVKIVKQSISYKKNYCNDVSLKIRKNLAGPGLKYFLAQGNGERALTPQIVENVPYLSDSDLDGSGRKVYFDVQGCQMNTNDAEVVWAILKSKGYLKTDCLDDSDIVLLVTCAIRDRTESKIWDKLKTLQAIRRKQKNKFKVGILGCMAERLKEKVLEKDKTVDLVAGPDSYKDLPRLLALLRHDMKAVNVLLSLDETYADIIPVRLNENSVSAYVSIMRGCDNMCTYCIVPFTRGRERSRPISSVLDEVRMLSDQGIKEIILLGQNVNSYRDISSLSDNNVMEKQTVHSSDFKTVYKPKIGGLRFDVLLDKVSAIDPEMRIRFVSPHPKDFPDEVLYLIKERKNICNCIHLPLQSGSNSMLDKMRRGYTREAYLNLVSHIREFIPNVALTTDIISGFCGETEEDHRDTLDLINIVKYNFIYMFPFSLREKTTAHRRFVDDITWEEKIKRTTEISTLFRHIALEINKSQIGQVQLVLIEGKSKRSDDYMAGRNDGNTKVVIPTIDIPIEPHSQSKRSIKPGDYVSVLIKDASSQSLLGTPQFHTTLVDFDPQICHLSNKVKACDTLN